jgi:prophage tail gpP-like protein
MDQRFSEYEAHILSSDFFSDQAGIQATKVGTARDGGVPRFRRRYIISEQFFKGQPIADKRAQWECNRRQGRSMAVTVRCDAWRDQAGALWAPNYSAPIDLPAMKLSAPDWVIGTVIYQRDETGQHAVVTLMPKAAFLPEPQGDLSIPLLSDVEGNNPTAAANPPFSPRPPLPAIP